MALKTENDTISKLDKGCSETEVYCTCRCLHGPG